MNAERSTVNAAVSVVIAEWSALEVPTFRDAGSSDEDLPDVLCTVAKSLEV